MTCVSMANKSATIDCWDNQRPKYEVVVSEFVIAEAGLGHPEAAERRLAAIEGIMELQAIEVVRALGQ
jgi:hypothetical protein